LARPITDPNALLANAAGRVPGAPGSVAPASPAVRGRETIRTTFERFELKFWIAEPVAQRIEKFVEPYMRRDTHNLDWESQRNTSLYLDTRGYRFYENHLALLPNRSKLRIRVYGRPFGPLAFFEVKRKVKVITMKDRFVLPIEDVPNVLGRRRPSCPIPPDAERTFGEFMFQMSVHRAEPKIFVACYRQAFDSKIPGEDVRVTIDRELVYQPATGNRFEPDDRRWVPIQEGDDARPALGRRRAILELKFDGRAPPWVVDLVRCFDLTREAFSKYTTAVQQLRGRE
jgi:hypothetical protein